MRATMASMGEKKRALLPDAKEVVFDQDSRFACDSYIFEPAPREEKLGFLFAVGEVEDRGGVGRELLDLVMSAIQREYFRDPKRGATASFEQALHQANLILHDSNEQGLKDWMSAFHVIVGVLAGGTLQISVAGQANILLARKTQLTDVGAGLAVWPIVDPLRTFSQVATGTLTGQDVLFLGTSSMRDVFSDEVFKRLAMEKSASTIAARLQQHYFDQRFNTPLAVLVISLLPHYVAQKADDGLPARRRSSSISREGLQPRRPIILRRSWIKNMGLVLGRLFILAGDAFRRRVWPHIVQGSVKGSRALYKASRATGRGVKQAGLQRLTNWRGKKGALGAQSRPAMTVAVRRFDWRQWLVLPLVLPRLLKEWWRKLPRTSKIFASMAVLFAITLIVSLVLLTHKRAADQDVQHASELLHSAQTKVDAAGTALIYDNRDQTQSLLKEADELLGQLAQTGLYVTETEKLRSDISTQRDRLQRVFRVAGESVATIGDFAPHTTAQPPRRLWFINGQLFTFNPENNAILRLTTAGEVSKITQTTQGIGFFTDGVAQNDEQTITFVTDSPGIALFDAKQGTIHKQDISFTGSTPNIQSLATFGNRLYVFDAASKNIQLYTKTLRGFSGGEAWITDEGFPRDSIRSIAIDGNIFTLHTDGKVFRLFKGAPADFALQAVTPDLSPATRLLTTADMEHVYVFDPVNKRVVVLTKEGALVKQIYFDAESKLSDMAVDPEETTLYVLDETRVLAVKLEEQK